MEVLVTKCSSFLIYICLQGCFTLSKVFTEFYAFLIGYIFILMLRKILNLSWDNFSLTYESLEVFCSVSKYFGIFPATFLLLVSSLISLWTQNIRCMIIILLNLVRLVYNSECSLSCGCSISLGKKYLFYCC